MPKFTSELQSDPAWRLPTEIVKLIYSEVFAPLADKDKPSDYHHVLQRRLKALGEHLGYQACLEHPTPYIDRNRSGRVDVVWTCPHGGRSVAIEIDTGWKRYSIVKLLHMSQTHLPVWIFLGTREVPHIGQDHEMAKIHLLRVDPARLEKKPDKLLPSGLRKETPSFKRSQRKWAAVSAARRKRWKLAAKLKRLNDIRTAHLSEVRQAA